MSGTLPATHLFFELTRRVESRQIRYEVRTRAALAGRCKGAMLPQHHAALPLLPSATNTKRLNALLGPGAGADATVSACFDISVVMLNVQPVANGRAVRRPRRRERCLRGRCREGACSETLPGTVLLLRGWQGAPHRHDHRLLRRVPHLSLHSVTLSCRENCLRSLTLPALMPHAQHRQPATAAGHLGLDAMCRFRSGLSWCSMSPVVHAVRVHPSAMQAAKGAPPNLGQVILK
jgi:hypothetical protein